SAHQKMLVLANSSFAFSHLNIFLVVLNLLSLLRYSVQYILVITNPMGELKSNKVLPVAYRCRNI
ncbi:hypothetical protein BpHYR1_047934, partial [Brachionus plicatilis]